MIFYFNRIHVFDLHLKIDIVFMSLSFVPQRTERSEFKDAFKNKR
jgi:hypothetical protein